MKFGTLIVKSKIIASSTANNTIDKSAQSVLLIEGASADAEILEDTSNWSPNNDEMLAAGTIQFPSGGVIS